MVDRKAQGLQVSDLAIGTLQQVAFAVAAGECVSLSGASGSGKTRLLRALADLDPHVGQVRLHGRDACSMPAALWRRRIGMLPAESFWWHDEVGAHFDGDVAALLATLGFGSETLGWQVARLSSGERQRLGLARLLAVGPEALLLDEPSANLDPENRRRVEQVVADYCQQQGAPVVWVSHDVEQRQRVASRHLSIVGTAVVGQGQ